MAWTLDLALERRMPRRGRLWGEFVLFYVCTPLAIAVFMPPQALFPVLLSLTAVGLGLLSHTEGFRWSELIRGLRGIDPWLVLGFAVVTTAIVGTLTVLVVPQDALALVRGNPLLLASILLLYPPLSALPQEIVFRVLFFRRYGPILPGLRAAIVMNAALFSLAHLMYWNAVVCGLTFLGGLVFAWACEARRNFPLAVILHAVAGWILFTGGLGVLFHAGNAVRPF
ncbi:CPBP family intramembrane glutamic endopeptidase [Rhodovulum sulfidophilum]|uniref:CPBP family intramembrane glutamic endopeptidase n=1 Tax=Rhodovulum sulfidophilum TaxID=35806 RepID=UPI0009D77FD7|nr:CPBP family intramembrane glutamic endopeptidase [Rhodovulum sulfidophilum]